MSKNKTTFLHYFKAHPNITAASAGITFAIFVLSSLVLGLRSALLISVVTFPILMIVCIYVNSVIKANENSETTIPKDRIQLSKDEIIMHRAKLFAQYFYIVVAGIMANAFVGFLVIALNTYYRDMEILVYSIISLISLLVCIASIIKFIITRNRNVILTNKRLFIANGVTSLNIINLRLSKIERFDISQGFWARLFNTSTIKIRGIGGGLNTIKLRGIKDPLSFLNAFNTACDALESGKTITPVTPNTETTNNITNQPDNTINQPETNTDNKSTNNQPDNTTNQPEINTNTQDTTNTTTPTTSTP